MHFRFEVEDDVAVVYIYELQVDSSFRKQGLGKYLMDKVENFCAAETDISTAMLTVFKHNQPALTFYERLGYKLHQSSPRDEKYVILHKTIG